MNSTPLVSVIIPTHRRPQFLPRAIDCALQAAPDGDVEVIVVPNGPDTSWKTVAEKYQSEKRIVWSAVKTPHANVARNHGMGLARGVFIRFLDDDDYLYPEPCRKQCESLTASAMDMSSGAIEVASTTGRILKQLFQPDTNDLTVAALSPKRRTQCFAHLYKRSHVIDLRWDEDRSIGQDTAWLIKLTAHKETAWHKTEEPLGAWVQHQEQRISRGRDPGAMTLRGMSNAIQNAYIALEQSNRLTPERRQAAADALWTFLQKGLRYDRAYWKGVAKVANGYYPGRRPPSVVHRMPVINKLDPLLIETLIIPIRRAYHPFRKLLERLDINRV